LAPDIGGLADGREKLQGGWWAVPRTRIWVLLYAQVMQADGATRRNVLIARAPAIPHLDAVNGNPIPPQTRDVMGPVRRTEH
jgi:hypothetical protein